MMVIKRILFILFTLFIMSSSAVFGLDFSDTFDDPGTYMLPVNAGTLWTQLGAASGTFSMDVGSVGTGHSLRLSSTNPGYVYPFPAAGANNTQYYNTANAIIQADIKPNSQTGTACIGFGVYSDMGDYVCGGFNAGLTRSGNTCTFFIAEGDEYKSNPRTISSLIVNIDVNQFHRVRLESLNGVLTATLDGTWTLSGTPQMQIDAAGIGLAVFNGGDFSFDNFSFTAEPDSRHVVFSNVSIIENSSADVVFPSWSSDGKKLAYMRRENGSSVWNIWVKQIDPPLPAVQCTDSSANAKVFAFPCISPDNNFVFFSTTEADGRGTIKRASTNGSGEVYTVISESGLVYGQPVINKITINNQTVYYIFYTRSGPTTPYNIYALPINPDGSSAGSQLAITNLGWGRNPYLAKVDDTNNRMLFMAINSTKNADLWIFNGVREILTGTATPATQFTDSRLTSIVSNTNWQCTAWFSGDRSLVYYSEDTSGLFDIAYMNTNQGAPWLSMISNAHFESFAVNPDNPVERFRMNYYRPYSQGLLYPSPDGARLVYITDKRDVNASEVHTSLNIVTLTVQQQISIQAGAEIVDLSDTTLTIPPNSLVGGSSDAVSIIMSTPLPGDVPSPATLPNEYYALAREITIDAATPPTVNQANPPWLTIHYTHEEITGLVESSLVIYTYNESTSRWEPLSGCIVDPVANTISAPLPHFSLFAVSGDFSNVTMPDVTGKPFYSANPILNDLGIWVNSLVYESSSTIYKDYVIRSNPPAGTDVPNGSWVELVLSSGPQPVAIPNVVGITLATAQANLTTAGLVTEGVTRVTNSAPFGQVIAQYPAAGNVVVPGTGVYLTVSNGPVPLATIPNLTKMPLYKANPTLNPLGLWGYISSYESSPTIPKNYVIRTDPAAGNSLPQGSWVGLVISTGP
jgi:beta-lactam-binding protein with PASTA domain